MATDGRDRDDTQVRDWLRRGDPAADGSEPDAAELVRMRRTVLAAARQPAVTWPRLAWGTALAALALMLVALWMQPRGGTTVGPTEPRRAAVEEEPATSPDFEVRVAAVGAEAAAQNEIPAAVARVQPDEMATAAPVAVAAIDATAAGDTVAHKRQIQFVGSGGTKILWTLDSEFELGT